MPVKEELVQAVGAHVWWKEEFARAINDGRYWVDPDVIESDRECAFGRWLYGLSWTEQRSEYFKIVQSLHATFHEEAAQVMRLAMAGDVAAAQTSIGMGLYNNASTALLIAMREWMIAMENSSRTNNENIDPGHARRKLPPPTTPKRSQPGQNL